MASKKKSFLVVGLDFGTTYSGYAYSFNYEYECYPLKIQVNKLNRTSSGGDFYKTPTVILFPRSCTDNNDVYFGDEAEAKYESLVSDKKSENWLLFRQFKMRLYYEKNLCRATILESVCAKHHSALDVFSKAIGYFTRHLLGCIKKEVVTITMDDIDWVITVPTIWTDAAKQFMMEAALEAGIQKKHLMLALEPEAASLYCRILRADKSVGVGKEMNASQPGTKYMTVDIGGGTVDVTVHQIESDRRLKEIHKASGGAWGGAKVDENFISKLHEYCGQTEYEEFARKYPGERLELQQSFEQAKRREDHDSKWIGIYIPGELRRKWDQGRNNPEYKWSGDKIRLRRDIFEKLFEDSINSIIYHLSELLKNPALEKLNAMYLVGGYSECRILQNRIMREFQQRVAAIRVPRDAGLAVMLGAVLYGHDQSMICKRISRATYGIKSSTEFNPKSHHLCKKDVADGKTICRDIFDIFLKVGQTYECGQEISKVLNPQKSHQRAIECNVYISPNANVKYVTDSGCEMIGSLRLAIPYATSGTDCPIDITFRVGGTYLDVLVKDRLHDKSVEAQFDFLSR